MKLFTVNDDNKIQFNFDYDAITNSTMIIIELDYYFKKIVRYYIGNDDRNIDINKQNIYLKYFAKDIVKKVDEGLYIDFGKRIDGKIKSIKTTYNMFLQITKDIGTTRTIDFRYAEVYNQYSEMEYQLTDGFYETKDAKAFFEVDCSLTHSYFAYYDDHQPDEIEYSTILWEFYWESGYEHKNALSKEYDNEEVVNQIIGNLH